MGVKTGLLRYLKTQIIHKTMPEPEFVSFISSLPVRGRLLDVGCGIGLESDYAQKLSFDVTGIDNDYGCLKKAKELNDKVDFRQIDFFNYIKNVPKNEFKIIIDSKFSNKLVLSHLKKYYSNIAKALDYGGYMYLQALATNDAYCKTHCPVRSWTKIDDVYIRYFSRQELMSLLRLTGLKIESFKTIKQKTHIDNEKEETTEETYHIVIARQTVKKW